jgi:hypothetical protein
MPRYLVERVFEPGADLPRAFENAETCAAVVAGNRRAEVTWLHSYVSTDGRTMFCVYDGPSPEAVRHAALVNRLPVDAITEVRSLDPYRYERDEDPGARSVVARRHNVGPTLNAPPSSR